MDSLPERIESKLQEAQKTISSFQAKGTLTYTPLLETPFLQKICNFRLLLKCENLQVGGAFKARGAFHKCAVLAKQNVKNIVAFSSGNHAWAVALAAKEFGMHATIIMPVDAPDLKIAQTKLFTDDIVFFDRNVQSREDIGAQVMKQKNASLIPPYDDEDIIAGQGTVGLEIIEQCQNLGIKPDYICVPCGGGGLLAGTSIAIKNTWENCNIYGVEPEDFDDTRRSFHENKRLVNAKKSGSICDALLSPQPGEITFPINKKLVKNIITVSDKEAMQAMKTIALYQKIITEPGGVVAAAALMTGKVKPITPHSTAVAIISGGNPDFRLFTDIFHQ